ncbi:CXXC motif containing zinc binding protein isoform X2 [Ictalurus furcatus]|nr:CXXC motif containing zinc binding protein isoform X2 [Ictalurus furcatus]XP_053484458.1 CXXC motif containing zinc binding protein isoform X2 [Ictalurus furcatus]XP_053484459.1 CXXC motif containing zinc binding protein isoform X2 [Ictalurus furcatus]
MPLKGGRGSASMVQKCKLCSRENSIDILKDTITPYNSRVEGWFESIPVASLRWRTVSGSRRWCSLSVEASSRSTSNLRLDLRLRAQRRPPSSLKSTFRRKTGQTMTRKLASQWASMKSHISLSSVESIGDGAQMLWLEIQQRKRDFIQGTFIKFNKNTLIVVVEIVNGCVWGEQARTFTA